MNYKHIYNYVTHFSVHHVTKRYDAGEKKLMYIKHTLGDSTLYIFYSIYNNNLNGNLSSA